MTEVSWELLCLHTRGRPRRISRNFPKEGVFWLFRKLYSFHSVHSAIGSRMNGMIFRSFRKRNWSQKYTDTVYSEYSYSGIVPKEWALNKLLRLPNVCASHNLKDLSWLGPGNEIGLVTPWGIPLWWSIVRYSIRGSHDGCYRKPFHGLWN